MTIKGAARNRMDDMNRLAGHSSVEPLEVFDILLAYKNVHKLTEFTVFVAKAEPNTRPQALEFFQGLTYGF